MGVWLVSVAVFAMLAHSAWGMWLVRSQHRDLSQLSAQMAAFMIRQLAAPRPEYLRPPATDPARSRFDPPTGEQATGEIDRVGAGRRRAGSAT